MNADDRLRAAFGGDAPPARDLAFNTAVMAQVARRRLWLSLVLLVPPTLAAIAVLWALGPLMVLVGEGLGQGLAPAAGMTAAILALALFSVRVLARRGPLWSRSR